LIPVGRTTDGDDGGGVLGSLGVEGGEEEGEDTGDVGFEVFTEVEGYLLYQYHHLNNGGERNKREWWSVVPKVSDGD